VSDNGGRRGRRYLRLCAQVRARREDCGLCRQPIDYTAPPRTPTSFSLDHITSLAHGGDLLDPANARAAHFGCNSKRGGATRQGKPELVTSRWW
jgi:5-methylcytosine-specific restriction endonuclease McrA